MRRFYPLDDVGVEESAVAPAAYAVRVIWRDGRPATGRAAGPRVRRLRTGLAAGAVAAAVVAMSAAALSIGGAAKVSRTAVRGEPFQATATLPAPAGCRRVVVIGDSLMDNSRPWLVAGLRAAGFDAVVDAQPSRRIPGTVRTPFSGVRAAASVRATFGDAECWVIALGSNDLVFGANTVPGAAAMIEEMLAAVTPSARVWWVNLNYHRDPAFDFGFPAATTAFNTALSEHARRDADLTIVDWYSFSEAHLAWFFDPVHVDRTGSIARADLTVAALPRPG